jgi:hypothetical protein
MAMLRNFRTLISKSFSDCFPDLTAWRDQSRGRVVSTPEILLQGGIMAQPLEKTKPDGSLYTRPAGVEKIIDTALTQDLDTHCKRALIRDYDSADYMPSECLLHLIRKARRADDERAYGALIPLVLARCEANLNKYVAPELPGAVELRKDILGDFAELLAIDGTPEDNHQLDYFEIRFNGGFAAFRKTRVRDELVFQNRHLPVPESFPESDSVEQELADDFIARLADFQGDSGNQEDRAFRKQLLAAIRELPREEQVAILLVHHFDYTRAKAAELCDVDERTIRNRLHRAHETLSKLKEGA